MINQIWSVLCKESIIDSETNLISLIDVMEELNIDIKSDQILPDGSDVTIAMNYEIVSLWTREPTDAKQIEVKIELFSPEKALLKDFVQTTIFPDETIRLRTRFKIKGFTATVNGEYKLNLLYRLTNTDEFKLVTSLPLFVRINNIIE